MILEVLITLKINKSFFYKDSKNIKNIKVGSIVEVEFNRKKQFGVVVALHKKVNFSGEIKEIKKFYENYFLSSEIIKSIYFISNYSCFPPSRILKLFISNLPKSKKNNFKETRYKFLENKYIPLNDEQILAVKKLKTKSSRSFEVFVLKGVTGSGKTRVYMKKVIQMIQNGLQCLVLVPEIILTNQWVDEISNEFNLYPEIYHSSITKKNRERVWYSSITGKPILVVGTRSSLFLPFSNLGLIVVDEEHDTSYKQEDQIIINIRDFAIVRAKNSNCQIILSSASPSIETIFNVSIKKYKQIELNKRINKKPLPVIKSIDMRGEKDLISDFLIRKIKSNIEKKYQTLLFINKRGYASFVICSQCGTSQICPNCNISLVLHEHAKNRGGYLLCHHCNYKKIFANKCENCNKTETLIFPGVGIEKIVEKAGQLFPNSKICVLSSDNKKKSKDFGILLEKIKKNEIDIIIGTQIISKGHNFPFIKTVGILNIDNSLNDFDFRSFEKTFNQITQVSGRAGRKGVKGEVFIQTFQPSHPVIKLSKKYDKKEYYNWEMKIRKKNLQPPFVNLISLIISSRNNYSAEKISKKIVQHLKKKSETKILGPAPAIISKINNVYRYRILIKLEKNYKEHQKIKKILMNINEPQGINIHIDVDPLNFI